MPIVPAAAPSARSVSPCLTPPRSAARTQIPCPPAALLLCLLLLLFGVPRALRAQGGPSSLRLSYGRTASASGHVQVREWDIAGDRLTLDDLGLSRWEAFDLEWTRRTGPGRAWRFGLTTHRFTGETVFPTDVNFNGGTYAAGGTARIDRTELYQLRMLYQRGTSVYGLLGLVVDLLDFHIDAPLSADSRSTEKRENFARQWVPLPVVGFGLNADQGGFYLDVFGTRVNHLGTWYNEGGRVYLTQTHVEAAVGLRGGGDTFRPHAALRYRLLKILSESDEDTNAFEIKGLMPEVGLEWRF